MKMKLKQLKNLNWILSALIVCGLASCQKENSTGFTPGTGAPMITSVSTLSKTINDTLVTVTTTYDASGNMTTKVDSNKGHQSVAKFDSTTATGNKQNYYIIHGSNLGSATTIMFNGVAAYFNRALNSDNTLIVSIPLTVPTAGAAATNKLTVVTLYGKTDFSFTTLTPPPTIATISDFDFWSGSQITIAGVGFATVTGVGITGTTATATIVSQTDGQIVLQFPVATVTQANLVFSYSSAGKTSTVTTKQVFNDLDNAYQIFVGNQFQNSWVDASWSGPSGPSNAASHIGTASLVATYPSNGWKIEGWAAWNNPVKFVYDPSYKYLSFWVKGGSVDYTLNIEGDKMVNGYGQNGNFPIIVPAKVWTFFKIPLGAPTSNSPALLNLWATGSPAQQLGFFLKGKSTDPDETMYFDEVAFIK
jgi:hypothetical protein